MVTDKGEILRDRILAIGNCPGYRDMSVTLRVNDGWLEREMKLSLGGEDALWLMRSILQAQRCAWERGRPLDAPTTERRPEDV